MVFQPEVEESLAPEGTFLRFLLVRSVASRRYGREKGGTGFGGYLAAVFKMEDKARRSRWV